MRIKIPTEPDTTSHTGIIGCIVHLFRFVEPMTIIVIGQALKITEKTIKITPDTKKYLLRMASLRFMSIYPNKQPGWSVLTLAVFPF